MSISDETLLEKLAGNNLELRKHLQQLMGKERFSTAEELAAEKTERQCVLANTVPESTTKH